jgi:hypothetical protein
MFDKVLVGSDEGLEWDRDLLILPLAFRAFGGRHPSKRCMEE